MWQSCLGRVCSLVCTFQFAICAGEIQALHRPVNGTLGQSVILPGISPGSKDVEVVWKRTSPKAYIARYDKGSVKMYGAEEYKRRIKFHLENFSLQISDLQREDSGVYEVVVITVSGGETAGSFRLDVYERVSGTKIRSTVTQGNCNATLTCSVTSGDRTSFRWWRGREELGNDSAHRLSGHGEELQIYFASDPKDSVYRCEGRNPVSEETAQIELSDVCNITVPVTEQILSTAIVVTVVPLSILILLAVVLLYLCWKKKEAKTKKDSYTVVCKDGPKRRESAGESTTVYAEVNSKPLKGHPKERSPPDGDELVVNQKESPAVELSITVYDTIKNLGPIESGGDETFQGKR